jgi:hypothetical protein
MPFNVVLFQPEGYAHAMALREVALLLYYSLNSLGEPTVMRVNTLDHAAVNVLVGYQHVKSPQQLAGYDCVIYQLEQLTDANDFWTTPASIEILRSVRSIWDYDQRHVQWLKDQGVRDARFLPLGYHEMLRMIPQSQEDIDVIFYGSGGDRRERILRELEKRCRLRWLFGVYGPDRDAAIARSRIVLNLHRTDSAALEQARISYLLNNGRFVLSEESPENPFAQMIATAPYEKLVEACLHYLVREDERKAIAKNGEEQFRKHSMTQFVQSVLQAKPVI